MRIAYPVQPRKRVCTGPVILAVRSVKGEHTMGRGGILAGIVAGLLASVAWGRVWTSTAGTKLEAEFVERRHGAVILKKTDGSHLRISEQRLSKADRDHIREITSTRTESSMQEDSIPDEPAVETGFVGRPEFDTRDGKFGAGTAFLVKIDGESCPVLITAQHIFGPAGGLRQEVPRGHMSTFAKRASLRDLVKGRQHSTKVTALPVLGDLDVAAFRTTLKSKMNPRPFASSNPKEGDPIWLVASLREQPRDAILHRGIVMNVWANELKCKFDNGNLIMRGASGAPDVNAYG